MNPLLLLNVSKLNPCMFWFLSQIYPVHRVIVSLETFPISFVIIMIIIFCVFFFFLSIYVVFYVFLQHFSHCWHFLKLQLIWPLRATVDFKFQDLIGLQPSTLFQAVQRILVH